MQICPSCGEENSDRFRLCGFCGARLAPSPPPREVRKTVTVVFTDLVGSTALAESLDPESVREVMNRYFAVMREVLERHGGVVEKYIGDAVMAVFGLPRVHEDDAVRAVRATADMQRALARLNEEFHAGWGVRLSNRTGVNTGEVIAGDRPRDSGWSQATRSTSPRGSNRRRRRRRCWSVSGPTGSSGTGPRWRRCHR